MSGYDQEYDNFYYDDGRFEEGAEDRTDDYDIPTYDELDLEGRYYTYGSRADYNAWREEEIARLRAEDRRAAREARREEALRKEKKKRAKRGLENLPPYSRLTADEKKRFESREAYQIWRKEQLEQRQLEKQRALEEKEKRSERWMTFFKICLVVAFVLEILFFVFFIS